MFLPKAVKKSGKIQKSNFTKFYYILHLWLDKKFEKIHKLISFGIVSSLEKFDFRIFSVFLMLWRDLFNLGSVLA